MKSYIVDFLKSKNCFNVRVLGDNIHCRCPFHKPKYNDTSFSISWKKDGNPYHCLSCGVKGNLNSLLKYYNENINNIPQINELKQISNEYSDLLDAFVVSEIPTRSNNDKPMYDYLNKRSCENYSVLDVPYIIEAYKLYYCDSGKYSNRVIMPIYMHGEILGYNNRSINNHCLKTINQKNVSWSKLLYGFDQAMDKYHCSNDILVVVEGAFDLFQIESIFKGKYCSVVALMGTVFNQYRAELLSTLCKNIIFYLDNDLAGIKCANQYVKYFKNRLKVGLAYNEWYDGDAGSHSKQQILKAIKNTQWVN